MQESQTEVLQKQADELMERILHEQAPWFDRYLNGMLPSVNHVLPPEQEGGRWRIYCSAAATPTAWPALAAQLAKDCGIDGHYQPYGIDGQPRVANGKMAYIRVVVPTAAEADIYLTAECHHPENGEVPLSQFYAEFEDEPASVLMGLIQRAHRLA